MRLLRWTVVVLLLLIVAAVAAIAWIFSTRFLVPNPYTLMPEFEIVAVGEGSVTLPLLDAPPQFGDALQPGVANLLYEGGYGRLGEVLERNDDAVVRAFEPLSGRAPEPGDPARTDILLFYGGPAERGIDAEVLTLDGEVGDLTAWWVDRGSDTAAIVLHGRRRGELVETLRIAPTLLEGDRSLLMLAYRNHRGSDPSPDGFYHYGASEYRDLLTAAAFLSERGVERVVVVGLSMGGAVALEGLERWPADAPEPVALILEAPILDARTVFRRGAEDTGLPLSGPLTDLAMLVGRWRAGVDWAELDQREDAAEIDLPLLLISGEEDATIPIALVDDYADRYGGEVTYRRVPGADHMESWNLDPERYEGWVREFLGRF